MLINIAVGAGMVALTATLHTILTAAIVSWIARYAARHGLKTPAMQIRTLVGAVFMAFFATLLEVSAWAEAFLLLGAIDRFETAFYFSTVTFTTLGYGDVVLGERWRMLASFEAVIGIIIFGWTTALVVAVVERVYVSSHGPARHTNH